MHTCLSTCLHRTWTYILFIIIVVYLSPLRFFICLTRQLACISGMSCAKLACAGSKRVDWLPSGQGEFSSGPGTHSQGSAPGSPDYTTQDLFC